MAITLIVAILAPIVVSLVAGYFSVGWYARHAKVDIRKDLESQLNMQRRDVYLDLQKAVTDLLVQRSSDGTTDVPLLRLAPRLLLVASDEALAKWLEWRKAVRQTRGMHSYLVGFASILIQMRKDLGYSTTGLSERDVIASFISNLEEQPQLLRLLDELETKRELDSKR